MWKSRDKVVRKWWERCEKVVRKLWEGCEKVLRKFWDICKKVLRKFWESCEKVYYPTSISNLSKHVCSSRISPSLSEFKYPLKKKKEAAWPCLFLFRQKAMVRPNTPLQDACDTYMKLVCDCLATVSLIYTMKNGSIQLKNG